MKCRDLASVIEELQPSADLREVARLCLLLANSVDDPSSLRDERALCDAWQRAGLRLQAAADQHAAMTDELAILAHHEPSQLTSEQIWILIRAIKVQSHVLQMYVGHAPVDV